MSAPGILFPIPRIGILPAASMKAFFWAPGGTTKQNTYTDSTLATPNLNPLVADGAGLFPAVFLDPTLGYKIALYPSTEVNDPPTGTAYLTQDNAWLPSAHLPQVLSKVGPTNYTVLIGDGYDVLILADATAGSFTISPYTAIGNTGKRITVKKTDSSANTVTIDPNGAQTWDGSTTLVLSAQYQSSMGESDGANWYQVVPKITPNTTKGMFFGHTTVATGVAAGVTAFLGSQGHDTTESAAQAVCPVSGVIRNLYAADDGSPGAGKTFIYTVRVAGADTAVTCTTSDAAQSSQDVTHSVAVTAGQKISVKLVVLAGASTRDHAVSFEIATQ